MDREARKPYSTDLTDAQWGLLEPHLPPAKRGGRPRTTDLREVVNAILYLNRGGIQWELLPHDFPAKSTVYDYFAFWRNNGTWQRILDVLREVAREHATPRAIHNAIGGEHRQPNGQDVGDGRRPRLRWREENHREKADNRSGHAGISARGGRVRRVGR